MKILIGTPVYDEQVLATYHTSITALLMHYSGKVRFEQMMPRSSIIAFSRNAIVTRALLDPSISHVLFVDADMAFSVSLVEKMLAFDEPVVGCIYPHRNPDIGRLIVEARRSVDPARVQHRAQGYIGDMLYQEPSTGLWDVRGDFIRTLYAGTGLLLLKREALARMRARYPELTGDPTGSWYAQLGFVDRVFQPFQPIQGPRGIFGGEDAAFSARWSDMGGEIWACFTETTHHTGRWPFAGNYAAVLNDSEEGVALGQARTTD